MARRENDLYTTDSRLTALMLAQVGVKRRVLEPCAGPSRMADALVEGTGGGVQVITNDIEPAFGTDTVGDATCADAACWQVSGIDLGGHQSTVQARTFDSAACVPGGAGRRGVSAAADLCGTCSWAWGLALAACRSAGVSDHGESASEVSDRGDQPGDRRGVRDGLCDGGVVCVVEGLELAAAGNSCAVPVCDGLG